MFLAQNNRADQGIVEREGSMLQQQVRQHLEALLKSAHFDASVRSRQFLRFVIDETLAGRSKALNQTTIAMQVFGRGTDFDAVLDPIVRVQAGRLRRSLERYYLLTGDLRDVCIQLPKGCYAPVFTTMTRTADPLPDLVETACRPDVTEWPTVLIHPFVTDPADEAIAAHLKDEFAMELCRYDDVHVVRQSSMHHMDARQQASIRFEFRGTLRCMNDERIMSARLIDRHSGQQVWSDEHRCTPHPSRWSCGLGDMARVMAARLGCENGAIARVLATDPVHRSGEAADSFGPIARAYRFLFSRQVDELVPTIQAVRSLTARAPQLAAGWTYLARLFVLNHTFQLSPLYTPVEKAIDHASRAVMLDPGGTRARSVLATALLAKGEIEAAREELHQVLQLNPDSLVCREVIGWLLALSGEWDHGVALMRETMQRNPYCSPQVYHGLWADQLRRGDFEGAHRAALEYRDPGFFWRDLMMACCLGHLGRTEEAQGHVAELLLSKPQFPAHGRTMIQYYIKAPALRECIDFGLRKAGLVLT
ncbi:adenylate cyclase [Povalibacter uvarum]|uniref:Adenylate cyclase n=1 Tax=Povalibacter uvarum TaxID=732238 RepID=A0A841HS90_9GAMM|nr:tetratricopeptide repeat protein [Povalibacter uvarum]MBB6095169.1 adenylate cyclase [Povalibacter uvarum]